MPKHKQGTFQQLQRLGHVHATELDQMSDAEVLQEAAEIFGSAEHAVRGAREIIERAVTLHGKQRLKNARASYAALNATPKSNIVNLPLERKKAILSAFADGDASFSQKLTLAARSGKETEADLDGLIEDLIELGIIDELGNKK